MHTLKGKVALITGASRGIGASTALLLADHGFNIAINYCSNEKQADEIKKQVESKGSKAILVKANVSRYEDVVSIVQKTKEQLGSLELIINNAGLLSTKNIEQESIENLHTMIDVNVKGVVNTIHAVIPIMKAQGEGTIINIASMAGIHAHPGYATYSASKFAVNGLTQALGPELSPHNIDIYSICPGPVQTDMIEDLGFSGMPPEKVAKRILDILSGNIKLEPGGISELPS